MISYTLLPAMNKNLHTTLVTMCTSAGDPLSLLLLLKHTTYCLTVSMLHHLDSINIQQVLMNVNGCHFFLHGGIQFHIFASCALPCQTPFCQTVPLLPSVTWHQHVTEYWREGSTSTATPPTLMS